VDATDDHAQHPESVERVQNVAGTIQHNRNLVGVSDLMGGRVFVRDTRRPLPIASNPEP
jgi:hypothetical protein